MTLKLALRLGRTSNLPTVWTNVLAASVLCGADAEVPTLLLLCLLSTALYVGGMFLNDAFDVAIDARERPERPIPSGEISAKSVFAWGFGMLGIACIASFAFGLFAGLAAIATSGVIVLYNAWHKGNPAGPFLMGMCRMGIYAIVGWALCAVPEAAMWWGGLLLLGYVLGLTYAARFENKGGVGRWLPLAGLAAPAVWVLFQGFSAPLIRSFLGAYALWVQRGVTQIRSGKGANIKAAVGGLIAGIALLDALLIASRGETVLALVCVGAFGLTLALQSRIAGT